MATINTFTYFGRLVRDPELRKTGNGNSTVTYILAQTEISYDGEGNKKERITYLPVTTYGRQAENDAKFLKKGSSVIVTGKIRSWYVKDTGKSGFNFEAVDVQYVGSPSKSGAEQSETNDVPDYLDDWAKDYDQQEAALNAQAARENRPVRQRS